MINQLLQIIYENTINIVQNSLEDDFENAYKKYLRDKYEDVLKEFAAKESEKMLKAVVNSFIDDEIRFWKDLNENEKMSVLVDDPAFEHLTFLSEVAFEQAKKVIKSDEFIRDEHKYHRNLEDLALCLDDIKPFNVEAAKELLSEAILDINYAFGKSELMSLRLGRLK